MRPYAWGFSTVVIGTIFLGMYGSFWGNSTDPIVLAMVGSALFLAATVTVNIQMLIDKIENKDKSIPREEGKSQEIGGRINYTK